LAIRFKEFTGIPTPRFLFGLLSGLSSLPGSVTAEYAVGFPGPTPLNRTLHFKAGPTRIDDDKVFVKG
jgi:hypothetical protein